MNSFRPSAHESSFDTPVSAFDFNAMYSNTMNNCNAASSHTQASAGTSTSTLRAAANAVADQYLVPAPTSDQYFLTAPAAVTAEPAGGQLAVGTVQDGTGGAPTV